MRYKFILFSFLSGLFDTTLVFGGILDIACVDDSKNEPLKMMNIFL